MKFKSFLNLSYKTEFNFSQIIFLCFLIFQIIEYYAIINNLSFLHLSKLADMIISKLGKSLYQNS